MIEVEQPDGVVVQFGADPIETGDSLLNWLNSEEGRPEDQIWGGSGLDRPC